MKRAVIIIALLMSFVSFANNSSRESNVEVLETKINLKNEVQECYATCSVTIMNTETGETQTVSGFGHSHLNCNLAETECLANATANAKKKIKELNQV